MTISFGHPWEKDKAIRECRNDIKKSKGPNERSSLEKRLKELHNAKITFSGKEKCSKATLPNNAIKPQGVGGKLDIIK